MAPLDTNAGKKFRCYSEVEQGDFCIIKQPEQDTDQALPSREQLFVDQLCMHQKNIAPLTVVFDFFSLMLLLTYSEESVD